MPGTAEQRVEEALSQLVERLQPTIEGEDEEAGNERYFRAFDTAQELIQNVSPPAIVADENHVAELIKRRCGSSRDDPVCERR